jgi:MoaA/NifB/PqqE/SkfB family radical SAM enzyme
MNENREKYSKTDHSNSQLLTIMQAVVMKSNYHEIPNFLDFAKKYKFDCLNIIPLRNVYSSENIFFHKDSEALGYIEQVMPLLLEKSKEYGIKLFNQLPQINGSHPGSDELLKQKVGKKDDYSAVDSSFKNNKGILCHWPWRSLYILYNGMVKPYGFCEEHIGDVTKDSLDEIWNNTAMQTYRQKLITDNCLDWCSLRCTSGALPMDSLRLE